MTALAPFITVEDLAAAVPGLTGEQAEWLCDWASAAVRADVVQQVNLVADEITLDGSGSDVLLLPELEVHQVGKVRLDGDLLVEGRHYSWSSAGVLWRLASRWHRPIWPRRPRCITVAYRHGWDEGSPQFQAARQVALEVAARTSRNPDMLQSERIGDWSRAFVPTGGRAQLTDIERTLLDPLRRER